MFPRGTQGIATMQIDRQLTAKSDPLDAAQARDRWTWVSLARTRTASSLERQRAGNGCGFLLILPHQQETPEV